MPQLEALIREVGEADKEYQFQRTEREEKRRNLEMSTKTYVEPEASSSNATQAGSSANGNAYTNYTSDSEMSRNDSVSKSGLHYSSSAASQHGSTLSAQTSNGNSSTPKSRPNSGVPFTSPDKFKGFRDLEEKDHSMVGASDKVQHRKEGLLWALSRPGSHVDPKGLNKQAWHK